IDCIDHRSWTALHFAAQYGHSKVVDLLLDRGAALNLTVSWTNNTPLHMAALNNNVDIVQLLLQHPNIQPGLVDEIGWTPLMHACNWNNVEMVKLLISHEQSIPPNFNYKNGTSELHLARNADITRLLFQHPHMQPAIGLADKSGWTPLMHACNQNNVETVKLLISHEQSIPSNFNYKNGTSELHLARNADIIRLLLQHPHIQPAIGLADEIGWTPLMYACNRNDVETVKRLISHEKSIPPEFIYKNGESELHIAVRRGNVDTVRLLLQHPNI
ncbi:ankyrin repeat-containing domain protein, partial [Mycena floridula]